MESRRTFLGLGSNVGDRLLNILKAIDLLKEFIRVEKVSTIYESEPWGVEDQPPFLNCVLLGETSLTPSELLKEIKRVEREVGRKERFRWGPREIDIDILLYEEEVVELPDLEIPHPYIRERDFVLVPLLEIDPDLKDPLSGEVYARFLENLKTELKPFCSILPLP